MSRIESRVSRYAFVALVLLCGRICIAQDVSTQPPNFIFVLSDDIAQGDLGIYADKPWSLKQKSYAAQVTRFRSRWSIRIWVS